MSPSPLLPSSLVYDEQHESPEATGTSTSTSVSTEHAIGSGLDDGSTERQHLELLGNYQPDHRDIYALEAGQHVRDQLVLPSEWNNTNPDNDVRHQDDLQDGPAPVLMMNKLTLDTIDPDIESIILANDRLSKQFERTLARSDETHAGETSSLGGLEGSSHGRRRRGRRRRRRRGPIIIGSQADDDSQGNWIPSSGPVDQMSVDNEMGGEKTECHERWHDHDSMGEGKTNDGGDNHSLLSGSLPSGHERPTSDDVGHEQSADYDLSLLGALVSKSIEDYSDELDAAAAEKEQED